MKKYTKCWFWAIFAQHGYLKRTIFGHKGIQNKWNKSTQLNIFHVKNNNFKRFPAIFRSKLWRIWDFELFSVKNVQKVKFENFPPKLFSAIFKRPKNMFIWPKWGTFIVAFGRNRPKWAYLVQNGQILVKKCPKSQIWEFSPQNFLRHFLKHQKICFYGENEEHL